MRVSLFKVYHEVDFRELDFNYFKVIMLKPIVRNSLTKVIRVH